MKLTKDQAIDLEAQALADALCSGCLELNDDYLSRYCSEGLGELLKLIPCEKERAFILDSHLTDDNWRTMSGYDEGADVNLRFGEIEVQFEGEPADFFEEPAEWYVKGDLAYLPVDGICWTVDLDSLQQDINEWREENAGITAAL